MRWSKKLILPTVLIAIGMGTGFVGLFMSAFADPVDPADQWIRDTSQYLFFGGPIVALPGMYLFLQRLTGKPPSIEVD
jgi:hypothetical protein